MRSCFHQNMIQYIRKNHMDKKLPFNAFWIHPEVGGGGHLLDSTTCEIIDKTVDVSFVNTIGHNWIPSLIFSNDQNFIAQSTQNYALESFVEYFLSYSNYKKESDFPETTRWILTIIVVKYKRADSEALDERRKLLERRYVQKRVFCNKLEHWHI